MTGTKFVICSGITHRTEDDNFNFTQLRIFDSKEGVIFLRLPYIRLQTILKIFYYLIIDFSMVILSSQCINRGLFGMWYTNRKNSYDLHCVMKRKSSSMMMTEKHFIKAIRELWAHIRCFSHILICKQFQYSNLISLKFTNKKPEKRSDL